jgi:hypothetical protein
LRTTFRKFAGALASLLLLTLTLTQTIAALRQAGAWSPPAAAAKTPVQDRYAAIDQAVGRRLAMADAGQLRNPFSFVERRVVVVPAPPKLRPKPQAIPEPLLTAIIFDADPRALIMFEGQNYTVRANSLFADYSVVRITRDEVVLDQNGKRKVLKRPEGGSTR